MWWNASWEVIGDGGLVREHFLKLLIDFGIKVVCIFKKFSNVHAKMTSPLFNHCFSSQHSKMNYRKFPNMWADTQQWFMNYSMVEQREEKKFLPLRGNVKRKSKVFNWLWKIFLLFLFGGVGRLISSCWKSRQIVGKNSSFMQNSSFDEYFKEKLRFKSFF